MFTKERWKEIVEECKAEEVIVLEGGNPWEVSVGSYMFVFNTISCGPNPLAAIEREIDSLDFELLYCEVGSAQRELSRDLGEIIYEGGSWVEKD